MSVPSPCNVRLLSAVAWTCWMIGCASQHSQQRDQDAATAATDAATMAPDHEEQADDAEWSPEDATLEAAVDASSPPDVARSLTCQLCLDYSDHGPRLYVMNRSDQTCTVLHMVWDFGCEGLGLGRSELCLEQAALWPNAETCPPTDGGVHFMARAAEGSVVGHEGIIGIDVQLSFSDDSPHATKSVDFTACGQDYEETKPPCP